MTFNYVQLTEDQIKVMQELREQYAALYEKLEGLEPSRGLSLAKTKLEESNMWINKAITKND